MIVHFYETYMLVLINGTVWLEKIMKTMRNNFVVLHLPHLVCFGLPSILLYYYCNSEYLTHLASV